MELAVVIIRLLLAVVFVTAAVGKLTDQAGTRKAAEGFGVPSNLSSLVAVLLPSVEIVVAVLLVFAASAWFGAIGSVGLLGIFTIAIGIQLVKGNEPDCHCFGQLSSEKIGSSSLVRNAVFIALAGFLIARGQQGQGVEVYSLDKESIIVLLGTASLVMLAMAILLLRRLLTKQDELARRIDILEVSGPVEAVEREHAGSPHDGLPIGALLPEFELKDTDGEVRSTNSLYRDGQGALLLFVSPTCAPCKTLVPKFRDWATELSSELNVFLITSGRADENIKKFGDLPTSPLLLQDKREFAEALSAKWTPSAIYVNKDGRIASHIAAGDVAVEDLVSRIRDADITDGFAHFEIANANVGINRIELGQPVPEFTLPTIDGETISHASLSGKPTLVTFWSTTCPHCKAMESSLKNWESTKNGDSPELLIFSTGEIDENRELGFASPIALDQGNLVGAKLGMYGTPSAVLIDENGRFASEIAVGAPSIWALVGRSGK